MATAATASDDDNASSYDTHFTFNAFAIFFLHLNECHERLLA